MVKGKRESILDAQNELREIYVLIGEMKKPYDGEYDERIVELEDIIEPPVESVSEEYVYSRTLFSYCGDPSCNGQQCWECAAIRGGCPEDV